MRRIMTAILLSGLTATGCQEQNDFVDPPAPNVTVSPPLVGDITTYTDRTARVDALETVEIRARVTGILQALHFKSGTDVDKGALLVEIEPDQFEANVAAAAASLASREAELGIAEVRLEKVQFAYDKEAANEIEVKEAAAQRNSAAAAVQMAEAELDRQKIDLSYTKIYAPVEGRASRNLVDLGNLVSASEGTLLTTIVVVDPIYVYFDVSERVLLNYLQMRSKESIEARGKLDGEKLAVNLLLSNGSEYSHEGIVDFANNVVDPDTGTIQIRAVFPNPDNVLVPGTFVRLRAPRTAPDAMVVPEYALQRDIVGTFLLIVNSENTVERRDVELGDLTKEGRIILSGIEPSDRVITNGLQRARPGVKVTPEVVAAHADDVNPENDTVPAAE